VNFGHLLFVAAKTPGHSQTAPCSATHIYAVNPVLGLADIKSTGRNQIIKRLLAAPAHYVKARIDNHAARGPYPKKTFRYPPDCGH
jgi:hypothetical protein